ncbi:MAG: 7-carboxy-7-deazaguanine synthase QueE [Methanobacterium sp.]|nr:7-carboxy-7-deazaguanine synthase QueE [Methanobacterium sp.]
MKTHINEIFSSIQGEGMLIGRRQIFVRFSGCNLDCNYCDTSKSRNPLLGDLLTKEELINKINNLITPDFHSISLTGGEPLLHSDFIKELLEQNEYKSLLETNGSLPGELKKIARLLDYVSLDIKLPEHEASKNWDNLFDLELKSIKLLRDEEINTYCKVVVMPKTKVDMIGLIASKIAEEVQNTPKFSIVIQPVSPLKLWVDNSKKLFEISEEVGKYINVLTIPQVHKLLNVR